MDTNSTDNLGTQPMWPLFFSMAVPITIGMLVIGLYNVVDGIFITRYVGEAAMGAVSMVFPLQMLIAAVGSLVAAGAGSIITRKLGAKAQDSANIVAGNSALIAVVVGIISALCAWLFMDTILTSLGVEAHYYKDAMDYAFPIALFGFVSILLPLLGDIFRAEGKPQVLMQLMLTASILNIVLDYVFLAWFGWGVTGAAYATVLAQCIAVSIALFKYRNGQTSTKFNFTFSMPVWLSVLALGMPIMVAQLAMAIQVGVVNLLFIEYANDQWIIANGILGRIANFATLPLIAMLISFQTICGFNLGAQNQYRVIESIKVAFIAMFTFGVLITAVFLSATRPLIEIFSNQNEIIDIGHHIVWASIWGLPLAAFSILATGFYQAKGNASAATFHSGFRVIIVMLPLLYWLPEKYGLDGIFWGIVGADVGANLLVAIFGVAAIGKLKRDTNLNNQGIEYAEQH